VAASPAAVAAASLPGSYSRIILSDGATWLRRCLFTARLYAA